MESLRQPAGQGRPASAAPGAVRQTNRSSFGVTFLSGQALPAGRRVVNPHPRLGQIAPAKRSGAPVGHLVYDAGWCSAARRDFLVADHDGVRRHRPTPSVSTSYSGAARSGWRNPSRSVRYGHHRPTARHRPCASRHPHSAPARQVSRRSVQLGTVDLLRGRSSASVAVASWRQYQCFQPTPNTSPMPSRIANSQLRAGVPGSASDSNDRPSRRHSASSTCRVRSRPTCARVRAASRVR